MPADFTGEKYLKSCWLSRAKTPGGKKFFRCRAGFPLCCTPAPFSMATPPKRIVVKFGSGILASARGNALDERQFRRLDGAVAGWW